LIVPSFQVFDGKSAVFSAACFAVGILIQAG
jgi:hypothetical protein